MMWEVDLLYLFAHAATKLATDIDFQLKLKFGNKDGFVKKKRKALEEHENCIKNARIWLQKASEAMNNDFNLEQSTYESAEKRSGVYTNVIASANELIRASMLVVDRGFCDGGQAWVFKRLRSLPANGLFPDSFIDRFQMKYQIIPEKGDRVHNDNHGYGTLLLHTGNGNWNIKLDSGSEIILNEKQFKLC